MTATDSPPGTETSVTRNTTTSNRLAVDLATLTVTTLWVWGISLLAQAGGWLTEQIAIILGLPWPAWVWPAILGGQTVLLLVPLLPLARRWPRPRYRAIYRTWAVAALFPLFLIPNRMAALPVALESIFWQLGGTILFAALLLGLSRRRKGGGWSGLSGRGSLVVFLLVPLLAAFWLAWGALGSNLETMLTLVAGLLFGGVAAWLLKTFLVGPLADHSAGVDADITLGGFAAATTLLILATGLSLNGMQLVLMGVLSALGWLVLSLSKLGSDRLDPENWPVLALLLGLATAAPQALVDADELLLILSLGTREILSWTIWLTLIGMVLGLAIGAVLFWLVRRRQGLPPPNLMLAAVGLAWLGAATIYAFVGQPGFYGERLFVILQGQADLSGAAGIAQIDERRAFVYHTLVEHALRTQAGLRADLDRWGVTYRPYYLVNAIEVEGGPFLRRRLAGRPEVDRVLDSPILRPLPQPIPTAVGSATAPQEPQWNLTLIEADRVWNELGVRGAGVVIGQSDSGADWTHPELQATYRGRTGDHTYNWFDPWNHTTEPTDIGGHGTHTLGSIVGASTGVAPEATWFGCVNLARNLANPALYLDCMQFMLAPFPPDGDPFSDGDPGLSADVLNNSWGCPELEGCDAAALSSGTRALRAAGIFVVASAGNEGPFCESIRDPLAIYDAAFAVGAVDAAGELAMFSSRGPVTVDGSGRHKPDIIAPGVAVLSAYPNGSYEVADGTSMAGPHVVGVVALVWSANPALIGRIDETEAILRQTATPYGGTLPECGPAENAVGNGVVNAYQAVRRALEWRAGP